MAERRGIVAFTIAKQDIGDLFQLSIFDADFTDGVYKAAYNKEAHAITAELEGYDEITIALDISSVTEVGEYTIKAQIVADNYCGEKEFTVLVYFPSAEPDPLKTTAIAVGVSAGVVGLGAIGGLVYWLVRRRKIRETVVLST